MGREAFTMQLRWQVFQLAFRLSEVCSLLIAVLHNPMMIDLTFWDPTAAFEEEKVIEMMKVVDNALGPRGFGPGEYAKKFR